MPPTAVASNRKPQVARTRRTQEERSEATKQRILETSGRLIRENGIGGLRTAEVAEAAGVSQGAQFHHFPTKESLILATIEFVNARMVETARGHASAFDFQQDPIRAIIADASDFFMGDYFFTELAMGLSGENNKALLQSATAGIRGARLQIENLWKARLRELGLPKEVAAVVLDLTFNMVRGFAVRTLLDPDRKRFEKLYAVWNEIMTSYIADNLKTETKPAKSKAASTSRSRKSPK
jgi:AcrR family transcriptional regulator